MKGSMYPDAATIRAWMLRSGRPVGSRGAISAQAHNEYRAALVAAKRLRAGLVAGQVLVMAAPHILRAAVRRRA
ncbi:hypothetical protein [Aquipuribacter hungaricus]|uniref:hypothetical protein n=1 Tax=Aquipuribacter hungaricus TaxID=545624 RepID=UPI0030EC89EA